MDKHYIKGRGAQINTQNPYHHLHQNWTTFELEEQKTEFTIVHPKTIVNKVDSPDVGMEYSINPYQGCEHGCVYCYARNSHHYWGCSAGLDFESKIFVKKTAPELLRKFLSKKDWKGHPIVLSGNTDAYQPVESQFKITRELLKIFLEFEHPVGLITKSSLILRDIDLLSELARKKLVKVVVSLTSLHESTRRKLEPRTASVQNRLKTVAILTGHQIPVKVMLAPIIPGLNDHELIHMTRIASKMGAYDVSYILVRLNGEVGTIFEDWAERAYPLKAKRMISQIKSCHGGKLNESRFGVRMRGEGNLANIINRQFKLAYRKYFPEGSHSTGGIDFRTLYSKSTKSTELFLTFCSFL